MKSNVTAFIIITIVLAGGIYWYLSTQKGNDKPLSATIPSGNATQVQFQKLVSDLQGISFDTAIFSDPRFSSLVSLATPILPEASGRIDPFAPFSGAPAAASTQTAPAL